MAKLVEVTTEKKSPNEINISAGFFTETFESSLNCAGNDLSALGTLLEDNHYQKRLIREQLAKAEIKYTYSRAPSRSKYKFSERKRIIAMRVKSITLTQEGKTLRVKIKEALKKTESEK